jgi:SAM-dependent methyltransferase
MSIVDNRGFNQGFKPTPTVEIRNRRRVQMILTAARQMCADQQQRPLHIFEIGCGTGEYAQLYAADLDTVVTATDICEPFVAYANQQYASPRLSFAQLDMTDATAVEAMYASESFDVIVGNGILHHMYYDLDRVLPTLWRLLKPGGAFVFMEPNRFNPYVSTIFTIDMFRRMAKLEPGEMAFTPSEITTALVRAQFVDVAVEFRDFLIPVIPTALTGVVSAVSDVLERVPLVQRWSQSLLIMARKPSI